LPIERRKSLIGDSTFQSSAPNSSRRSHPLITYVHPVLVLSKRRKFRKRLIMKDIVIFKDGLVSYSDLELLA